MSLPGATDPDIGMCDVCGSEEGSRIRTIWKGCWAWLCASCRRDNA